MTSNSLGLSEILMIVFYVILLSILVVGVWRFFKTQRKIADQSEQIKREGKKTGEIQSSEDKLPGNPPK